MASLEPWSKRILVRGEQHTTNGRYVVASRIVNKRKSLIGKTVIPIHMETLDERLFGEENSVVSHLHRRFTPARMVTI